jgi:hypothetical protein
MERTAHSVSVAGRAYARCAVQAGGLRLRRGLRNHNLTVGSAIAQCSGRELPGVRDVAATDCEYETDGESGTDSCCAAAQAGG